LLKYVEEAAKYVEITGFRKATIGNKELLLRAVHAKIEDRVRIQFFNADLISSWEHLYFASLNSLVAFKNCQNISKRLEMETLLYASAQRQIRKAIEFIGIRSDSANVALIVISPDAKSIREAVSSVSGLIQAHPDDTVLELTPEKMSLIKSAFLITETEIKSVIEDNNLDQALTDLVIERMALLPTQI